MPESEKLILHDDVFRKHELSARHAGLLFCVFIFSHLSETVLCCNQRTRPSSSGLIILHSCKWHLKLRLYVHFKSETHKYEAGPHLNTCITSESALRKVSLDLNPTECPHCCEEAQKPAAVQQLQRFWRKSSQQFLNAEIFSDFGKC